MAACHSTCSVATLLAWWRGDGVVASFQQKKDLWMRTPNCTSSLVFPVHRALLVVWLERKQQSGLTVPRRAKRRSDTRVAH